MAVRPSKDMVTACIDAMKPLTDLLKMDWSEEEILDEEDRLTALRDRNDYEDN